MSLPPCELAVVGPNYASTFVAKVSDGAALPALGASELVRGAGAFACVTLTGSFYFVTVLEERSIPNYVHKLTRQLQKLPGNPQVEWVRPLTRRLQRLFGWGDVASTRADVMRAAKAGDEEELKALLPQAATMIDAGEVDQLPALHDALRAAPALEDCKHEFFQENRFECVPGPCRHGPLATHRPPFTRCQQCRLMLCHRCAKDAEAKTSDDNALRYAMHEALDQHAWSEQPNRKAVCSRCEAEEPHECACGARLCKKCMLPSADATFRPSCSWRQHPTRPLPFYVIDHVKVPEAEKLAWMRQELGGDANLETFATKFLELFGEKVRGTVPQKAACLKLYGTYVAGEGAAARNWKKECDLPPAEVEAFRRAWGQHEKICRECAKPVPADQNGSYCSAACAQAGCICSCPKCHKVLEDKIHPYCPDCKVGTPPPPKKRVLLMKSQWDSLALAQRMWSTSRQTGPDHEPAWKKRRRS